MRDPPETMRLTKANSNCYGFNEEHVDDLDLLYLHHDKKQTKWNQYF